MSLNEPQEVETFRANLDPKRFEFIDIGAGVLAGGPPRDPAAGETWLSDTCRPETRCDLMIYSAEFAGRFFGKRGVSLSLQEMEEASCQARCAGIFRQPTEVFLLACNTLATKDQDSRTPEIYLQVLLDHGFDRGSAERVVELRYGPLGSSFRESLRRVFAGVPRIYGFSSVAPRGEYTAPMLARYLRNQGDYAAKLSHRGTDTQRNQALFNSFRGTSLVQTTGLTAKEARTAERGHICALYDESVPVAQRLRIAYGLLMRPDALTFVPTLEVFLRRHPPPYRDPIERSVFAEIQNLDGTRESVLRLVRQLNVSALKLELAHFAVLAGWLERSEFHAIAVSGAAELLHEPLTTEVVDIMCEITKHESLRADFHADDIAPLAYVDAQGLRLLSCLAPEDPRVAPRVMPGLQQSADPERREWAAYAMMQLHPSDRHVLEQLVPYVRDPSPGVATRIRWMFQTQRPLDPAVVRSLRKLDPNVFEQQVQSPTPRARVSEQRPTRLGPLEASASTP